MSCRPTHKKWSAVPLFCMGSVSGHRFFLLLKGTLQKHRTRRPFQVQAKNHSLNMLKTPNFLGFFPPEIHPSNHMRRRRKKKIHHPTFKCPLENCNLPKTSKISHPKNSPHFSHNHFPESFPFGFFGAPGRHEGAPPFGDPGESQDRCQGS